MSDLTHPPAITLINSKNPEQMLSGLKVLFEALSPDRKAEEREFLGRKIYSVTTMAGPQLDPTNPKFRKLHFSQSGSYVLIATDEAVLEEYLRNGESQPKALRETPGLTEAIAKVSGPGTSYLGFQNQVEAERTAFALLKQVAEKQAKSDTGSDADTNAPVSGMTPVPESFGMEMPQQSLKEWFDYSLLPPFDSVAKYFNFTVYSGSANVDGLTLKIFAPTPPALRK